MLAFSGTHASTLEAEVLRKAKLSQELELGMAKLHIEFDSFKTETERLVCTAFVIPPPSFPPRGTEASGGNRFHSVIQSSRTK